jgi:integrative and conjugative element protein (TIGR02256 family)
MRLLIPEPIRDLLRTELRLAGKREIGGILFGEHLGDSVFRIADISVQRDGGTFSHFVRNPDAHREQLERFFERTGRDYTRFNYLGEWHSHPSFVPLPSDDDVASMMRIVTDPDVGVTFALLLIVRLGRRKSFELSATTFFPTGEYMAVDVTSEPDDETETGLIARFKRWFTPRASGRPMS